MTALATQVGGDHYKKMPIQPVVFCEVNDLNTCQANIIKYVCRFADKDGARDLKKAIHYCDLLIDISKSQGLDWERLDITARRQGWNVLIPLTDFITVNQLPYAVAEVLTLICIMPNPARVKTARAVLVGMLNKHYGEVA